MTPIRTAACNLRLHAEGCADLYAAKGEDFIASYWTPSEEEKAAILAGLPVKLTIMGHAHPPVWVEVEAL